MSASMSPESFSEALTVTVPSRLAARLGEVYLDAVTQLHEAVTLTTPVDTGYLRAGFQATTGDESPRELGPRNASGDYTGEFGASDAASIGAIGHAAKTLQPITLGFVAEYAPYVEDTHHMVKDAAVRWPSMVDAAIQNQGTGPSFETIGGAP